MTKSKLISFAIIFLLQWQSFAQINYSGTEFWINSCDQNSTYTPNNVLRIMGDVATVGNVSIPGTGFSQDFCFNSGGAFVDILLPYSLYGMTTSNVVQNNAIHITTDNNVIVVFFPITGADSDYYTAIPTSSLGTEYYINMPKGVGFWNPAYTQVTATENNTTVTITNPNAELGPYVWGVGNTISTGSTTVYTLNLGESVRFQAGQDVSTGPDSNLQHSGTVVTSDKPVFVSSSMSTNLPSLSYSYSDELRESLLPSSAWGNRYFTTEWEPGVPYLIQVVSADNSNTISIDGVPVATINTSEMFDTIISGVHEITSTLDVSVMEYSLSKAYTSVAAGDPSSFNLISESNFSTTFQDILAPYGSGSIDSVIYMLTVPTSAISSTTLNGTPILPSLFTPIGSTGYSNGIVKTITPASGSSLINISSSQPMMVYCTGLCRIGGTSAEWQVARNVGAFNNVPNSNVYDSTCALTILPVDYISFTGDSRDKDNILYWSTASEINNDYFLVEKSSNGFNFETIGRLEGIGTTTETSQYSFVDSEIEIGTCYYRLKQVDKDGAYEYSKVISLERKSTDLIHIYPNPAVSELHIVVDGQTTRYGDITIYDLAGKRMLSQNNVDLSNEFSLNVSNLKAGTYFIEILQNNQLVQKRFVKY